MSEKENGVNIQLDKKTYKILEAEAKKDRLRVFERETAKP